VWTAGAETDAAGVIGDALTESHVAPWSIQLLTKAISAEFSAGTGGIGMAGFSNPATRR
jgi:hypothetical protein